MTLQNGNNPKELKITRKDSLGVSGSGVDSEKSSYPIKFVSAILGPEMGAANFMDTWKKCVLSAGKTVRKIPPFLGGVGGGGVPILFLWARDFSDRCDSPD